MTGEGLNRRDLLRLFTGRGRGLNEFLRPPGAVEDGLFKTLCNGCGDCVKVCFHKSLKIVDGFPGLSPKESPCYLCEDFPCIKVCSRGALKPVGGKEFVRIGMAVLRKADCLAWGGMDCQMCFIRCPLMDEAITLEDFKPVIREERCTGCGLCEYACATVNTKRAVRVVQPTVGAEFMRQKGSG